MPYLSWGGRNGLQNKNQECEGRPRSYSGADRQAASEISAGLQSYRVGQSRAEDRRSDQTL